MQKYTNRTMTGFGSSCGACKFLRRKCAVDCVFAPYFCYEQAATHFAAVHKVFGASNVSRLLLHLPVHNRSDAAITISYEALARMQDPIYGCVAHIFALQQQVASLQEEIDTLENLMASSNVGAAGGSSSLAPTNSNNGIEFLLQHDATRTHYYQNQLATLLSYEEGAAFYQSMDRQMGIDYSDANGLQTHLLGESNPNPLQTILSGIDQEVFVNYPLFNVNAEIRN